MRRRFKVDPPLQPGTATVTGEEARHLRVVLRAQAGDHVFLFDGAGREAEAEIVDAGREQVSFRVPGPVRIHPRPTCVIELLCALPRAGAADDVIRVAVEMGATAIRPLLAERGVWRPDDAAESQRGERFTRAAVAALKQSGLSWMPEFLPPVSCEEAAFPPDGLAIVGSVRPDAVPPVAALAKKRAPSRIAVIVGPEGGLTDGEERALVSKGAVPVRLGHGILRVETAVVALLSHVIASGG